MSFVKIKKDSTHKGGELVMALGVFGHGRSSIKGHAWIFEESKKGGKKGIEMLHTRTSIKDVLYHNQFERTKADSIRFTFREVRRIRDFFSKVLRKEERRKQKNSK